MAWPWPSSDGKSQETDASIHNKLLIEGHAYKDEVVRLAPSLSLAVVRQRPGAVQELPAGHIGALAAGGGGDRLRGRQLGHGQERGSQEGQEQAARPRGG